MYKGKFNISWLQVKEPPKDNKSYNIIHKAEKQLLNERIKNINSIHYMYEHNRYKQYSHPRDMITENEIIICLHLINRIKEHRHDKIKQGRLISSNIYFSKSMDTIITLQGVQKISTTLAKFL